MTTDARILANRRNARKSSGPKTDEGKAAAAQNALKHGLTAQDVVCVDERSRDYDAFTAALRIDLAPADSVEEQLAERIILLSWRLRRSARAEASMVDSWRYANAARLELRPGESPLTRRFAWSTSEMLALSRYEASLDRALGRAYALLERRQARRRGEAVPAPVTVLVEGLPDSTNPLDLQRKNENCETKPMADDALLIENPPHLPAPSPSSGAGPSPRWGEGAL